MSSQQRKKPFGLKPSRTNRDGKTISLSNLPSIIASPKAQQIPLSLLGHQSTSSVGPERKPNNFADIKIKQPPDNRNSSTFGQFYKNMLSPSGGRGIQTLKHSISEAQLNPHKEMRSAKHSF